MSLLLCVVAIMAGLFGDADSDIECLILGALDQHRAAAFATVDVPRLADVYADASVATADRRAVKKYRERGVRVVGAVMHRESCRVSGRTPDRIELDVVDRLGPAVAVGREIRALPHDRPTRHRVTLVWTPAGWRIGAVAGP